MINWSLAKVLRIQSEKVWSLQQTVLEKSDSHMKQNEIDLILAGHTKVD